jgi:plasmid stability protein
MATSITIRDVSDAARNQLAARAARTGRSLQEYVRMKLEELARRPDPEDFMARLRDRKQSASSRLSRDELLAHRDADRR